MSTLQRQRHVKTFHFQVPLWYTFKTIWRFRAFTFRGKVWKKDGQKFNNLKTLSHGTLHNTWNGQNDKHHDNSWSPRNQLVMKNSITVTAEIPLHCLLVRVQTCDISFQSGRNKEKKNLMTKKNKGCSKRPCFIALHLSSEIPANCHESTSG